MPVPHPLLSREQVLKACTRSFGHRPGSMRAQLQALAASTPEDERPDLYGGGELLESFEREIAQLLGKDAAVFMPSGTMAQLAALRVHCDRRAIASVALHPQSHLLVSENDAMRRLHGLHALPLGDRLRLYDVRDLATVREPIGAVLLELPERNLGGVLGPWERVEEIAAWTHERGIPLHLDGARLWDSQPFYGRPLDALASPFDTVYVSFYKVLGAIAGAALAGPQQVIDAARGWQWRHGGRLVQQFPYVLSARAALRERLPRVAAYCTRAREIAAVLASLPGVRVTPDPPCTNMMHVYVQGEPERLEQRALEVSSESQVWLPPRWVATPVPGWSMCELSCGEGALSIADEEARELFGRLLAQD